jgi:hypothetical protein
MAKRPRRYPRWAYDATSDRLVEPVPLYREQGYNIDESPPAQWFNYWKNLLGGWVDYLRSPSFSNWTRRDLSSDLVTSAYLATDLESADDGVYSRMAIAGADALGAMRVFVSHRGHEWDEVSRFVDNTINAPRGFKKLGALWMLWTSTQLLTTPADGAGAPSALSVGGAVEWTETGESDLVDIAYDWDHGDRWIAVQTSFGLGFGWRRSADGSLWTTVGGSGSVPTGSGLAIVWSGTRFVSITTTGQVWTTPDISTGFTLSATIDAAANWRLAAGEGQVFAYQRNQAGPMAYRSSDHGSSWLSVALPASMDLIQSVTYHEGQWIATSSQFPYLWTSNDLVTWDEAYVPIPQDPTGFSLVGAAGGLRSVLLLGPQGKFVLQSTVTADASNGDPTTFKVPVALSDAAYLRGREIAEIAPAHGQAPAWNAATQRYEPANVGASFGDPNLFDTDYPIAGGAHDYELDPGFAPAAFPDAETGEECSGLLGDGSDVPFFYVIHPANVGALTRTATGRMRLTLGGFGNTTWPGNSDTPAIVYPLPRAQRMELEFTLYVTAPSLNNANRANFALCRNGNSGSPLEVICRVDIEATGASSASEQVSIWDNLYSSNPVDGYVSAGAFARHYRVVIDGPSIAVYGGAVGASVANTLIHGRSNVARGLTRNDLALSFCIASGGVVSAPLSVEHGPLHWEGIKS